MKIDDVFLFVMFFEFYILLSILLILFCVRLHSFFQGKVIKRETEEIREFILKRFQVESNNEWLILKKTVSLNVLLTVLEEYDYRFRGGAWEKIKKEITECYLTPLARKLYKSSDWEKRLFSARCFALRPQKEDRVMIDFLMKDSVFLVLSKASSAAIQLEDLSLLRQLVKNIAESVGYSRFFLKELVHKGSNTTYRLLEKILEENSSRKIQLVCLEILGTIIFPLDIQDLQKWITSSDEEIRFTLVKLLAHNPQKESLEVLISQIHNPNRNIRKEVLFGLTHFPSEKTLYILQEALDDEDWVVRLQAAQSLKKIGGEALDILKTQTKNIKRVEVANYVLNFY